MPYVMRTRNESTVNFEQRLDVGKAEQFVRAFNEAHPETRTTLFHVLIWASRQGLVEYPNLNRFVAGGRVFQRQGGLVSLSAQPRERKGGPPLVLQRPVAPGAPLPPLGPSVEGPPATPKFRGGRHH